MTHRRQMDAAPAVHEHHFVMSNPYQPEADRCECGTFRYEIMGPFARHAARLRAYGHVGDALAGRR
jgi:hypothetical protein